MQPGGALSGICIFPRPGERRIASREPSRAYRFQLYGIPYRAGRGSACCTAGIRDHSRFELLHGAGFEPETSGKLLSSLKPLGHTRKLGDKGHTFGSTFFLCFVLCFVHCFFLCFLSFAFSLLFLYFSLIFIDFH